MSYDNLIPRPKTKFLRVKCPGCGKEQIIFSAASTKVCCLACNTEFGKTGASKVKLNAKVIRELE